MEASTETRLTSLYCCSSLRQYSTSSGFHHVLSYHAVATTEINNPRTNQTQLNHYTIGYNYSSTVPICPTCLLLALQAVHLCGPNPFTWAYEEEFLRWRAGQPNHFTSGWTRWQTGEDSSQQQPITHQGWPTHQDWPHISTMSSDSSSLGVGRRGRRQQQAQPQPPPPLNLYFHSTAGQVEPPEDDPIIPPGYRLFGYTANGRIILERTRPWGRLAWETFCRGVRVVGAVGRYLLHGLFQCLCGLAVRTYRFVTEYIAVIPRTQEQGPVHVLPMQDYEPTTAIVSPPDLHQVGGTGPLLANNSEEATYVRQTVSKIAQIEEAGSSSMHDTSTSDMAEDSSSNDESEEEDNKTPESAVLNVGPHWGRSPPSSNTPPSGRSI